MGTLAFLQACLVIVHLALILDLGLRGQGDCAPVVSSVVGSRHLLQSSSSGRNDVFLGSSLYIDNTASVGALSAGAVSAAVVSTSGTLTVGAVTSTGALTATGIAASTCLSFVFTAMCVCVGI
eukprot:TRINITY_DN12361_c0_g1_i1.p2 TRINITY_DN12361_c0_g1~~TRINITY_DN12361_c0_g1_i1.p2  ORF type:complete len:123 (+),score=18.27 TRINITY_DN12361_c0_g1_i1:57-425(+)